MTEQADFKLKVVGRGELITLVIVWGDDNSGHHLEGTCAALPGILQQMAHVISCKKKQIAGGIRPVRQHPRREMNF